MMTYASIAELGTRMRAGQLSPVALAEHCLARIGALNPSLNAFITVTAELALSQARDAERDMCAGHWRGPLHGIPVAVKDFYDTAGIRTTAGAEQFANRVPQRDAEMVMRLRDAGAVLVGKTNMHTLGMGTTSLVSYFGPVVNPRSAQHVAGGSSGGSAAALAAGLCFATVDTDAVGSGRLPAAICGVSCLKPTFGALSAEGILAGEKADPTILVLSHPSVMACGADDVALVFAALTSGAANEVVPARRIGVVTNFAGSAGVKANFEMVRGQVTSLGAMMRDVQVPFESASFDIKNIERDRAAIDALLFAGVDAIMLPTLAAPAPTVNEARASGEMAVSPDNTFFCNYFGLPAVTVPSGLGENGLPFGVQFVGPHGSDGRVMALAQAYQRSMDYRSASLERTGG